MNIQKLAVVAVATFVAACGGDSNADDNSSTNNASNGAPNNATTGTNNLSTNNSSTNNGSTNGPTNGATNTGENRIPGANFVGLGVSADFMTGESAWHRVEFEGTAVDIQTTSFGSGDVAVSVGEEWAYAIDRNAGLVQVFEAGADLTDSGAIDLGGATPTNPQFATDAGGKVYVSLYDEAAIAVATNDAGSWSVERLGTTSLDPDGNPDASAITSDGVFVIVVLQRLENFVGVENSALLVIDSSDDSFVDFGGSEMLDLGVTNAQANLRWLPGGDLAVGYTGNFGEEDGGILLVERAAAGDYAVGDPIALESDLGGDLLDFVMLTDTVGIAVVSLPDFSSKLVEFEVSSNSVEVADVPMFESPGLGGLDVAESGGWWIAGDRGSNPAFGLSTLALGTVITAPTDLPPAGFVFVE